MSSFIPVSIVKDWEIETFKTNTPFNNKAINGYEAKDNNDIYLTKPKTINIILKNKSITGKEMNSKLSNTSITKPRFWPSRGLTES